MRQKAGTPKPSAETLSWTCAAPPRAVRSGEKIRIVLEDLRGEKSIAALCYREGETGKKRLAGETVRGAPQRSQGAAPRDARFEGGVAEQALELRLLKKV
ncbi:MAG: hypothetical protein EOS38_25610 [Mesorhizobium sp.]|nr:MAG: hypothetical protein EOS39_29715 [Mesorhizobium sp.]RWD83351.1 MAG: hypothetical protein EOS38_25610 [Mesorhizobium sp.]